MYGVQKLTICSTCHIRTRLKFGIGPSSQAPMVVLATMLNLPGQSNCSNMELTRVLGDLFAGQQQIVSHDGTGQYQAISESTSIGTSSCGLAALNCARKVFRLYQFPDDCGLNHDSEVVHDNDLCLLHRCLLRQTTEVRSHPCILVHP